MINNKDISILSEEDKIYTNNTGRKSFQWELWQYCNSLCEFCYLGEENRIHDKNRQLRSLEDLESAIDTMDFNQYNNISLIGGEFFQGQLDDEEIHHNFFKIIKNIFQLYTDKKIGSMWITCTLTIGNQKHLYELLDLAESMGVFPKEEYGASGLWLCTSWDSTGRFHTPKMKENWEFHMKNVKQRYPWVKFNTTIILQQSFVDMYIKGDFRAKSFMEEFNTTLFFKQCGSPSMDDKTIKYSCDDIRLLSKKNFNKKFPFFPTRNSFLKFLILFYKEDRECYDRLFNIMYRSDELHRNFIKNEHDVFNIRHKIEIGPEETGKSVLECGHTDDYAAYVDCNNCCICDRNMVADLF
jgi:hypothetical protein